jgi:endonuclease-8
MPEGDSIHRAAVRLRPLVGRRVQAESPHPRGLLTGVAAAVDGRVLESVEPVGKHLLLRFEGGVVVRSHLRMNGRWRLGPPDPKRMGRPWLVLRAGELEATQWNGPVLTLDMTPTQRLGPDLLADGVDVAVVVERVRSADPARRLGEVLLDQRIVAGLGNLWMAESLWSAGVSPWLPLGRATGEELQHALVWARREMRAAVSGPRPSRAVYRCSGRPCPRCGTPVRSAGLGDHNRSAYWCPGCQRRE